MTDLSLREYARLNKADLSRGIHSCCTPGIKTISLRELMTPSSNIPSGKTYKITAKHSGKSLDIIGSSGDNGAALQQYGYWEGDNQKFIVESTGDGYFKIKAKNSGKVLEIGGGSMDNGAKAIQWDWCNLDHQKFKIKALENGYYKIVAKHSGKVLEIGGGSQLDNATLNQWDWCNLDHQQFKFESPIEIQTSKYNLSSEDEMQPGVYLYEHKEFGGRWIRITKEGTTELWENGINFNDIMTSVRIVGDYRATFYQHKNLQGTRSTLAGNCYCDIGCLNVSNPYETFWCGQWCLWEFGSPQEIGNDQCSSVFVTKTDSYENSSRLVYPAGHWNSAIAGGSAQGWTFYPDGTFSYNFMDGGYWNKISGRYKLIRTSSVPWLNITDLNSLTQDAMILTDRILIDVPTGFSTPLPGVEMQYYKYKSNDAILIYDKQLGKWNEYNYFKA